MKIISWDDFIHGSEVIEGDVSLTIGVFDGIHLGHQRLFQEINQESERLITLVFTFKENPLLILKKTGFAGNILSAEQKFEKLKLFSIRCMVLIDFSLNFSKISGRGFWLILNQRLTIKKIVVGSDFRFGYQRAFTVATLMELTEGLELKIIDPVTYKGEHISSTRIRKSIQEGHFKDVRAMLGDDYRLDLSHVKGKEIKRGTVEIKRDTITQILPHEGIYRVLFNTDTGDIPGNVTITNDIIRLIIPETLEYTRIKTIQYIERF